MDRIFYILIRHILIQVEILLLLISLPIFACKNMNFLKHSYFNNKRYINNYKTVWNLKDLFHSFPYNYLPAPLLQLIYL